MKVKLIVFDEVNVAFVGLHPAHIAYIQKKTARKVPGATHSAKYRLGAWDGKESQFKEDGSTYLFMLPLVLPIVEQYGYEVDLIDKRKPVDYQPREIDQGILREYTGYDLRDYQVAAVNEALKAEKGIVNVATGGGKTFICAAIVKNVDDRYRTITIVPSENLVNQTAKDYKKCGLDVGLVYGKIAKGKKRDAEWAKQHVIATWQTLARDRKNLEKFDVLLFDECHECGDVMFDVMSRDMRNAHIRIGLTGTVPKDTYKREKIMCHIGGDVITEVRPKRLMDVGHLSKIDISMHSVEHAVDFPDLEWTTEKKYLDKNKKRMRAIAEFIDSLPEKNTLILTFPEFGKSLSEHLGYDFIYQETPGEVREAFCKKFDSVPGYRLIGSYDTIGTGISIDNIFQLVLVDVGKSEKRIIQGIGRACRLDSLGLHSAKVYDVYSTTMYSSRHEKQRKKIYQEYHYRYHTGEQIKVRS